MAFYNRHCIKIVVFWGKVGRRKSGCFRGQLKLEQLPCEQFLKRFEIFRAFIPPVLRWEKRGKFQNVIEITHKVVVFTFPCVLNYFSFIILTRSVRLNYCPLRRSHNLSRGWFKKSIFYCYSVHKTNFPLTWHWQSQMRKIWWGSERRKIS